MPAARPAGRAGRGWGWQSPRTTIGRWATGGLGRRRGVGSTPASPIVPLMPPAKSSSTPNVQEDFRHGSLPAFERSGRHGGNLVMHLGRYGNADSGRGPDSPVKVGGDEIAMAHVNVCVGHGQLPLPLRHGQRASCGLETQLHAEETVRMLDEREMRSNGKWAPGGPGRRQGEAYTFYCRSSALELFKTGDVG